MPKRYSIKPELLYDVENYLNITWRDEATDIKVRGFIAAGMEYLNDKYGTEADYDTDGMPRTLLFEFVRYFRDSALDVFENNYLALLTEMQNGRRVMSYVESAQTPE